MDTVIYFDSICRTPFWNISSTWNTEDPSFTPCFVDSALSWLPAAFLWLTLPYILYEYLTSQNVPLLRNQLYNIKYLIFIVLTGSGAVQLAYYAYVRTQGGPFLLSNAELISATLFLADNLLLVLIVNLQRRYGFINCGPIWFYLLLKIICASLSVPTYLAYNDHKHFIQLIFIFIQLGIEIILLLICSFADELPRVSDKVHPNVCPKDVASFTSKLTFWWYNSLVFKGFRRPLTADDLWNVRLNDKSATLFKQFNTFWKHREFDREKKMKDAITTTNEAVKNGKVNGKKVEIEEDDENLPGNVSEETRSHASTSLVMIIVLQFWKYFTFPCAARFVTDIINLANPIVMKYLILFTSDHSAPTWHGLFFSSIFVVTNISSSLTAAYQQHRMAVLGMRIRTALISAIYRKSLILASHSKKDYTTGEIVNLMAVDCQRFIELLPYFNFLYTAPVQIAIAIWLLWNELGISVLGGLLLMVLFIPINAYTMSFVKAFQAKQMELKDKRLKAISECLNGVKVLKLYAWEEAFIANIEAIRAEELKYIRWSGYMTTIFNLMAYTAPFMVTCLTFTLYIFLGGEGTRLTSEKAFVSVALFNLLRVPLAQIPNMATSLMLTLIAMKRLNKFLSADEIEHYISRQADASNAIEVRNASFNWDRVDPSSTFLSPLTLSNLNVTVPKGSLIAVVGSVGSGKSSFLYSLLGEMVKVSGSVNIAAGQKIAYVSQQAWIQNSTVRENILFGRRYHPDRYNKVIGACALKPDFAMLTAGDATEIGERGINLSGGQKQRLSVARACYSNSDLYLFDDPLSAVDSHVGKHMFDQVLDSTTGILRDKTRVLVTNALYMLSSVDQIVLLKGGSIEAIGTYDQLLRNCPVFYELIANYTNTSPMLGAEEAAVDPAETVLIETEDKFIETLQSDAIRGPLTRTFSMTSSIFSQNRQMSFTSGGGREVKAGGGQTVAQAALSAFDERKSKSKLVEAEKMESGQVTLSVYMKFFKCLGLFSSFSIVFFYFMMVCSSYGANFWLSYWTEAENAPTRRYLLFYFLIGATQFIWVISGWLSILRGTIKASTNLHSSLIESMIHAPMWFFDTTPLGRIVNRFSRDIDVLDSAMAMLIRILMNHSFNCLATIFTVSVQTPIFLVIVIPFLIIYGFIQRLYVAATRQLKRLESVSRSPIFTHFSETISGVSTLKAYGAMNRFIDESDRRVDDNTVCYYPNAVANCWLAVRLEFMACFLVFFAALFAVISKSTAEGEAGGLSGGGIGLSLSYALNVTLALNMCVRMYAELETNIVSVERISEYTEIPPEAAWFRKADEKLSAEWPEKGEISFEAYGTRYRPGLDLVLRSVDLTTGRGEKVGIVGRTGAGKSSLTLALFRIIEAANGKIWVDGVDISTLGLQVLRSRIGIIPQEPVLFCGSLRLNLDPFQRHTDAQLWSAIELSHLKGFVTAQEAGLDTIISEGGENLSVGQRQLICLGRALLRRPKVLVLDEATSSIDMDTDMLVQETIRSQFSSCTILTIAHRLNTILDSDRVLVLDAGNVAEFDTPANLLSNKTTIFYSLAKDAGIV